VFHAHRFGPVGSARENRCAEPVAAARWLSGCFVDSPRGPMDRPRSHAHGGLAIVVGTRFVGAITELQELGQRGHDHGRTDHDGVLVLHRGKHADRDPAVSRNLSPGDSPTVGHAETVWNIGVAGVVLVTT
jgi:hypothetical protein